MKNALVLLTVGLLSIQSAFSMTPAGTRVRIKVLNELSSNKKAASNPARLVVANDVYIDGELKIAKGTAVDADTKIQSKARQGISGSIAIQEMTVLDTEGHTLDLGSYTKTYDSRKARRAGVRAVGLSIGTFGLITTVGIISAPFSLPTMIVGYSLLAIKGKDVSVDAGSIIHADVL